MANFSGLDIRKEYREERESEMAALLESHQTAEKSAVAFAQSVIKSGFILNGGGIIAIPAIVTLFNLDAEKLLRQLLLTAVLFVTGLFCAWAAGILGFFTLAHKSDNFYQLAVQTARYLQGKYFPPQAQEMAEQAAAAARRAKWLRVLWITERYIGILFCLASVIAFVAASWVGGKAILAAPHKPPAIVRVQPQP